MEPPLLPCAACGEHIAWNQSAIPATANRWVHGNKRDCALYPESAPLLTTGPASEIAHEHQALWDWAHSHRLVVGHDGRDTDVHIAGIAPHCIGRDRVQLAPGVYVVADRGPVTVNTEELDQP